MFTSRLQTLLARLGATQMSHFQVANFAGSTRGDTDVPRAGTDPCADTVFSHGCTTARQRRTASAVTDTQPTSSRAGRVRLGEWGARAPIGLDNEERVVGSLSLAEPLTARLRSV